MREIMDDDNERWACYWAKRYSWALAGRADLDFEDLVQTAWLGILRAKEKYSPEDGDWVTYSALFIKGEIFKALGMNHGAMPPWLKSLNEWTSGEHEETWMDLLPDKSLPEMDEVLLAEERTRTVREEVNRLADPRQRLVVSTVALEGEPLIEAARRLGASPERARQLFCAAQRWLRRSRKLQALMDCELETPYHAHQGVAGFMSSNTSVVERAVLWRLDRLEQIARMMDGENAAPELPAPRRKRKKRPSRSGPRV